jgi:hypothetical protein
MRSFVMLSLFPIAALSLGAGCNAFTSADPGIVDGGGGAGATTSTGGSSGAGGTGGGGPSKECMPAEGKAPDATCGIFVSAAGDDGHDGSPDAPVKTLSKALEKGSTIYLCGGETIEGSAKITKSTYLFGGFDCGKKWVYAPANKTKLEGDADVAVLAVAKTASEVSIADVVLAAPDAKQHGASAIGLLVDSASASLTRVEITAGKGMDGADGTTPAGFGAAGVKGSQGATGCVDDADKLGGPSGKSMCGANPAIAVNGGSGGNGLADVVGGTGASAQPQPQPGANGQKDGKGGVGQSQNDVCEPGHLGANGLPGAPGAGASGLGTLDASGYAGADGAPGAEPGKPGYGGGGGGGAKQCAVNGSYAGPSGGGGGSGGCGGQPGTAGKGAGASLGIVSIGASFSFEKVTITTTNGGIGGKGGNGQSGGPGGPAGPAGTAVAQDTATACAGGNGGQGGPGGSGGGGLGGHSIGIAFLGSAPATDGVTITVGDAGLGGEGGDMNKDIAGAPGQACAILDFGAAGGCAK